MTVPLPSLVLIYNSHHSCLFFSLWNLLLCVCVWGKCTLASMAVICCGTCVEDIDCGALILYPTKLVLYKHTDRLWWWNRCAIKPCVLVRHLIMSFSDHTYCLVVIVTQVLFDILAAVVLELLQCKKHYIIPFLVSNSWVAGYHVNQTLKGNTWIRRHHFRLSNSRYTSVSWHYKVIRAFINKLFP